PSRTPSRLGAAVLLGAALTPACHRNPTPKLVPPQTVRMDSEVLEEFYDEIQDYVKLRQKAVSVVPVLPADATGEQIAARQKAFTRAIVEYRRKARQGEIFKREIEAAFRHVFQETFDSPEGPAMIKEIRSGNPKV